MSDDSNKAKEDLGKKEEKSSSESNSASVINSKTEQSPSSSDSSKNDDSTGPDSFFNSDMIDLLSSLLGNRFQIRDEDEMKKLQKLETLDLEGVAKYLNTCTKIIFMTGAGISTAAGIPDFRSPKTGLYQNLEKYNLPYPEAIFDIQYFRENPKPFFLLSKELMPSVYKPTLSHYFQRLLVEKGKVLRCYSQNIDALESVAQIPDEKVIHAHGSFKTGRCLSCRKQYSIEWMKKQVHENEFLECEDDDCKKSGANEITRIVKPDITFFGEELPAEFANYRKDFPECELLIVMGTSLKVQPFGSIANHVKVDCPRLLINRELVGDWEYYLEDCPEKNYRDVAFRGDCDEGCLKLAELLGYKEELLDLIKRDYERLDKL